MSRWLLVSALGVLCTGILDGSAEQARPRPTWYSSYETARAEARKTGKPIMVVFRCER